jgi:parallel beta-helix repeat protein
MFYFFSTAATALKYIEVNGLHFDGNRVASQAILCQTSSAIISSGPYAHHLRFVGNTIQNTGAAGIATRYCDYIMAIGNRVHAVGNVRGWGSALGLNMAVWVDNYAGFHNIFVGNIISGVYDCCGQNRIDDPGDDQDITDGNGIINDRSHSGDSSPPTLIANNLIYQNGGRCIVTFHASNNWIINNTCYQNGLDLLIGNDGSSLPDIGDIQVGGYSANNYVVNNITHTWTPRNSYQLMTNSDAIWMRNLWTGGEGLYNIPFAEASDPARFVNGDALFASPPVVNASQSVGEQYLYAIDPAMIEDSFTLHVNSPAVDAGIDPRTVGGKIVLKSGAIVTDLSAITQTMTLYLLADLNGNPRSSDGADWDLGAYEYVE